MIRWLTIKMNEKPTTAATMKGGAQPTLRANVEAVLAWLRRSGKRSVRDGMARFAIPAEKAFGIPVGDLRKYAKDLGRSHELATALWETGWYEARLLAAFLAEPACSS